MPAVKAFALSKEFTIGTGERGRDGFRETLSRGLAAPFRRLLGAGGSAPPGTGRFWALKDVSFEVAEGDAVGIIGRNGAGKSTLLKILSRITPPTAGRAELRGRINSLLEVGTGFHPDLTGRENIYLNGAVLGMRKAEIRRKFDEIVAFSEVETFIDTPVKRYSSGMYVRLAFAVAAHLEPEILVVDEVLAVGDVRFQKKCLGKMEEAGREGRTILFVSHNLAAVRALCGRALLLEGGRVVADGAPEETIGKYLGGVRETAWSREWIGAERAPGNGSAALRRVSVTDLEGRPPVVISTDIPFHVEIDYAVLRDGASVGLNAIFYDGENNCVLASINNHEPDWYGRPMPAGEYRSVCRIPANLFNNGTFSLSLVLFGKNYTDAVPVSDVLILEVQDGPAVRGDYFGTYACPIRPLFEWTTRPRAFSGPCGGAR